MLGVAPQQGHWRRYTSRCALRTPLQFLPPRRHKNVSDLLYYALLNPALKQWDLDDPVDVLDQKDAWVRAKRKAELIVLGD